MHSWCNHGALVCKRSYRYTCAAHFWKKGKQCTDITIQIHSCTLLPAWNVFMSIHFSTHFWKKVKHCNDDTSWVHSCSLLQRVNVSMGDFHFRVNSQHDYGICAPGWQHDCTKMSPRVHRKCTTIVSKVLAKQIKSNQFIPQLIIIYWLNSRKNSVYITITIAVARRDIA